MTNIFLKVNKDLFKLGLNPTEILVLAQILEYNTNTGDCFISDKAMAEAFGVSDKTISRTMGALEEKGYITRDTKSTKGGKIRHITININKIDKDSQQTNCPLPTDKLSLANGQNDLIKDNIKDNKKEKIGAQLCDCAQSQAQPIADSRVELPSITMEQALIYWDEFDLTDGIITSPDGKIFKLKGEKQW